MKAFISTLSLLSVLATGVTAAPTKPTKGPKGPPGPPPGRGPPGPPPQSQSCSTVTRTKKICVVPDIGMTQDSGPNIRAAFQKCRKDGKIIMNADYLVKTLIVTPTLSNVEIDLGGTIVYDNNITYWGQQTNNTEGPGSLYLTYQNQTTFLYVTGNNIWLHGYPENVIAGSSALDGQGQVWYDAFAKPTAGGSAGPLSNTFSRPILITIGNSSNVCVEDITLRQAPEWNSFLDGTQYVTMRNINVTAVSTSKYFIANTDGIDVYRSDSVTLDNWTILNGDDAVSLKPNCSNISITNMNCNGSHGISVGSLGQYRGEVDIVENVYVGNIQMANAQNGARIKVFPNSNATAGNAGGGTGYVRNVTFENFANINVDNPLILTTCYNYQAPYCAANPTAFIIEDIHYINVTGTSSGKEKNVVVSLDCSAECEDITAVGTNILPPTTYGAPVYDCHNVASENQLDFKCTEIP